MSNIRIKTEVEMFPRECNWILMSDDYDFEKVDKYIDNYANREVYEYLTLQWYERPNEDNLLNTLTEALEGAYDYD